MRITRDAISPIVPQRRGLHVLAALALLLVLGMAGRIHAASPGGTGVQIRQHNGRFTIAATDTNLKTVLFKLAEIAGITIRVPASLDRKVTIEQDGLPLKGVLERLLKGLNHVIVYAGKNRQAASITRVLVMSRARPRPPMTAARKRLTGQIAGYERRIESLRQRLSRLDAGSRRAQRYQRRIDALERSIRRMQDRVQ